MSQQQQQQLQQIVYYSHEICFSHTNGSDGAADQYYQPKFFLNAKTFHLAPMEDIVVVLESCGANWFRTGISHDMTMTNNGCRFEFTKTSPKQLCLYVRNYSDQAHITVEQGTELISLLNKSEIIYKIVAIPVEFFRMPRPDSGINKDWVSHAADEEEEEEGEATVTEEEMEGNSQEFYYVKIFKKTPL